MENGRRSGERYLNTAFALVLHSKSWTRQEVREQPMTLPVNFESENRQRKFSFDVVK
jgi:hypothetical protein